MIKYSSLEDAKKNIVKEMEKQHNDVLKKHFRPEVKA